MTEQKQNILNDTWPVAPPDTSDTTDGKPLFNVRHPDDFPWDFIHKLWNVLRRKK